MKRSNAIIIPVNPNTPKKRRRKNLVTYGQTLSFTSDTSDTPRSMPTQDENLPYRPLSSPWTPTPRFRNWESSKSARTSFDSDFSATSGVFSAGSSQVTQRSVTSSLDPLVADVPSSLPLGRPATLLKLRRKAGQSMLATSGMRTYNSPGTPPTAQSVWKECKEKVLQAFTDAGRSPLELILDILDSGQHEYENYRSRWFSPASNKLSLLLDRIFAHPKGHDLVLQWMQPHALDSVCSSISSEMDLAVKELSLPSVEHVSSEFISHWTLETIVEPAYQLCPSLSRVLEAAAQTEEARQKNKIKFPKTVGKQLYFLFILSTNTHLGLQYNRFSACVPTIKPIAQVSICLWPFSLEHWIIEENDRCALSLQLDGLI
jgi:hypothetical protein